MVEPDSPQRSSTDATSRVGNGRSIPPRVWVLLALIYLITVPWYLPRDWIDPTIWAFPAWSMVMIAGAVCLAAFNAYVFLRLWPEEHDVDEDASKNGPRHTSPEKSP